MCESMSKDLQIVNKINAYKFENKILGCGEHWLCRLTFDKHYCLLRVYNKTAVFFKWSHYTSVQTL